MKINAFPVIVCFLLVAFQISCKREVENQTPPTIELIADDGFISTDTIATPASSLNFKLLCNSNGDDVLTNIIVSSNGVRIIDEGINTHTLERLVTITKNGDQTQEIEFRIRDISSKESILTIAVELDNSNPDTEPTRYNSITLKAQGTEGAISFFSFVTGSSLTLQDAFANQANVHLVYYFDTVDSDLNTITSPGANIDASIFNGSYSIPNWTTRNTLRFVPVNLSNEDFEAINSVLFLVNSYTSGNRKAKLLKVGDVYSFLDESRNKYGMFRVNSVSGQTNGEINISIVVQP
jgi:hypothetical protein